MKTLEFDIDLNGNNTLFLPDKIAAALQNEKKAHVIIIPSSQQDEAKHENELWTRLGAYSFFKDDNEEDSVYDNL